MKTTPIFFAVLCLSALLLAGCQNVAPQKKAAGPATNPQSAPARLADLQMSGKIIRVNVAEGYVVAECAVLPNTGDEARVLRGENEVGRVRFAGPFSFPYAIGDVISGQAAAGDRVRK